MKISKFFLAILFIVANTAFGQLKSSIKGDFNGDKKTDEISIYTTKAESKQPPQNGGTNETCEAKTTLKNIKNLSVLNDCGKLYNEGDLDGNGTEEFSIVTWSPNGTQASMNTYKIKDGKIVLICSPKLEPGIGTDLTDKMIKDRVYKKSGVIYYKNSDSAGIVKTIKVKNK
jgi:hypothetical protein